MPQHVLAINEMEINEADSAHAGFFRRYFAAINVALEIGDDGLGWYWTQVDLQGNAVSAMHGCFETENKAKADALEKLNGAFWE